MKKNILILLFIFIVIGGLIHCFANSSWYTDIKVIFLNINNLKEFVSRYEVLSPLVFFLIQIIQVIISPIPGNITILAGGCLFGFIKGFILNSVSIISGSIIAFYLAKYFGKPLVIKIIGYNTYNKYSKIFNKKYVITLLLMFLFPFFPDDALCFLAGISTMQFSLFFLLILFGRVPNIFVQTLIGADLLNLTTSTWCIIAIIFVLIVLLTLKYRRYLENWLHKRIIKMELNNNNISPKDIIN